MQIYVKQKTGPAMAGRAGLGATALVQQIYAACFVTRYGKTDHSQQTLNLSYVSSKFNRPYAIDVTN